MLKAIVEDFGNGGTIDGDLTISGDLTVSGGGSLSFDEILEGTQVIDVTSTEAFLVRKNGDGGDVFVVDSTNSRVGIGTTSPDGVLDVEGTDIYFHADGGEERFLFQPSNAGGDARMRMYNNAQVVNVDIAANGNSHFKQRSASHSLNLDTYSTTEGHNASLDIRHSNHASNTVETDDDTVLGTINFKGVDNGSNFDTGAGIQVIQNGSAGTKVPCDMSLFVSSSSATNTVMVLDSNSRISLSNNDDGNSNNTVFGYNALTNNGTVPGNVGTDHNVAIGHYAMGTGTTGATEQNVAVGIRALEDATTANHNTCVGAESGNAITTGDYNTCIGSDAQVSAVGAQNQIVIGYNVDGQADNSVTLGNADVTAVYMSSDSGALVHTAGIQFPASQAANAGANVLDDYEEGTWTPTFVLATAGDSSWTEDRQVASYTKIGNICTFQCFLRTDAYTNSSGSGNLRITGLPFASDSTSNRITAVSVSAFGFAADNNPISGQIGANVQYITLYKRADANDGDTSLDENSTVNGTNKNSIMVSGSYRTA
jgi:hypothetical protein